jgi:hemolysin activation/secretion protein
MKHSFRRVLFSTTGLLVCVVQAGSALAQVPNTARPDLIERQNRIETPRPDVGGAPIVGAPARSGPVATGGPSFVLNGITVEGATALSEAQIGATYRDKIGSTITLGDLNAIADDITNLYRNSGYILTRAVVPPQSAKGGQFTIRVVEGFVNEVRLTGDVGKGNDALLQAYANKITAAALERYLLLMEDLPGVGARAVLEPAVNIPGASDVVVAITRRPVDFSAGIDNRGSRFLGPVQANASVGVNNILGLDELTQLRVSNSIFNRSELRFGEVRHTEQVGGEGTTLTVFANAAHSEPGSSLKNLEIVGDSGVISAGVSHPIVRSRRANWFVNGDITARNVEVDTLSTSLYKDKTRVVSLGTSYDFVDGGAAINKAELTIGQGLNWGTSQDNNSRSRANGRTDFLKANAKLTRIQPLFGPFALFAAASGQHSNDALLASEEFVIGGAEFGSAYDSAELSGDSGVAGRAELQFNQAEESGFLSQYQIYSFYDIGKVWNKNPIAGSENPSDSLASAGLGTRFNLMDSVSGGIEGAFPLTRNVASRNNAGDEPRVFFNLQYKY